MIFAGHIGLTLAIAKYGPRAIADMSGRVKPTSGSHNFRPSWVERLDDRVLILGSVLPDIVDKPLALFIAPTLAGHSLRNYGHTLVFAILMLAAAIALAALVKRRWPVVLALASAGHLLLDMMWYSHRILLWPFSASTFSPRFIHEWGPDPDLLYVAAEAAGIVVLCYVGFRLVARRQVMQWLSTGFGA